MVAIGLSILAASFYGGADFLGGLATKRAGMISVTLISQAIGLVCLLAILPFFEAHPTRATIAWSLAGGVCGGIGIALLYHALSIGRMGVVSPITAVLAAALPVTLGIFRGDALRWFQFIGIAVALLAIVLISLSKEASGEREIATSGVKEAIVSGIALGLFLTMLGVPGRGAGLDGLLAARVGGVAFLLLLALATRSPVRPGGGTIGIVVASGVVDMAANVLYVIASQSGALAIAAVMTSLYPASTVFLARIVLGERLQFVQKIGVGLALIGVALIAA